MNGDEPFIGSKKKPAGAGFYPEDMTRAEFEGWVGKHPEDKAAFEGLFTVIRREGGRLVAVPYSKEYRQWLEPAAARLREAAAMTGNASLRDFLEKRASALLSDDYFASDVAWMDLDSDIDVVFGPYEVYEDSLFNFKAAFESFVTVRDKAESAKLAVYAAHLPDMEKNLPIPDQHKNFNRKFESPIRVVQEVFTSGDARRGVQTSAFNLPNDERVREAKGSKKVLLKNVMDAKFRLSGRPIAERVIAADQLSGVSFDAYFNHVLFHELSHGLGPGHHHGTGRQEGRGAAAPEEPLLDDRGVQGRRRRDLEHPLRARPEVADVVRRKGARRHDRGARVPFDALRPRRGARRRHGGAVELVPREGRRSCRPRAAGSASIRPGSARP